MPPPLNILGEGGGGGGGGACAAAPDSVGQS